MLGTSCKANLGLLVDLENSGHYMNKNAQN